LLDSPPAGRYLPLVYVLPDTSSRAAIGCTHTADTRLTAVTLLPYYPFATCLPSHHRYASVTGLLRLADVADVTFLITLPILPTAVGSSRCNVAFTTPFQFVLRGYRSPDSTPPAVDFCHHAVRRLLPTLPRLPAFTFAILVTHALHCAGWIPHYAFVPAVITYTLVYLLPVPVYCYLPHRDYCRTHDSGYCSRILRVRSVARTRPLHAVLPRITVGFVYTVATAARLRYGCHVYLTLQFTLLPFVDYTFAYVVA